MSKSGSGGSGKLFLGAFIGLVIGVLIAFGVVVLVTGYAGLVKWAA